MTFSMQYVSNTVREIIQRKPARIVILSLIYVFIGVLIKWKLHIDLSALTFVVGAVMGIYFLDTVETFLKITPSPFTSILFAGAFLVVSIFIVTSSNSALATGLVLTTYATLIDRQVRDIQVRKNLNDWFAMVAEPVSVRTQFILFGVICMIFVIESLMYFR